MGALSDGFSTQSCAGEVEIDDLGVPFREMKS